MLRPFFSYYGSKWRAGGRVPPPVHRVIVEPFAGSAGYSLRYPDRQVILYDLDPVIAGIWRFLISAKESEILSLPDLEPGQRVDSLPVCQEAKDLIGFWCNKGSSQPANIMSKWARNPKYQAMPCNFWGPGIRERIASQQSAIRHWMIVEGTYKHAANIKATWYVDPPYAAMGYCYAKSSKSIDFQALGDWCKARRGQVIVCEQQGANWLPFQPFGAIKSTRGTSKEVVWIKP
tara:strand:+ start:674 stop:1372 length:699 start_codon:yes stop_codon:yes gene_type:complete